MTDEVKKIREEVVGIINSINLFTPDEDGKNSSYEAGKLDVASKILQIIDSMQEEPVSEDLEEAAKHYLYSNILYDDVYVGNPTDKDCIEMFNAGANWKEQQLMAKAVDATVHIDAGGYPYIPQMELYDYDKDIPLAKEGEKVKVIVIKED